MYAITEHSYRVITTEMALDPGESRVDALPVSLLTKIREGQIRAERNQLLRSTDWTQMFDAPLTATEKQEWGVYRQALRDLPAQPGFPDCEWPSPPA